MGKLTAVILASVMLFMIGCATMFNGSTQTVKYS